MTLRVRRTRRCVCPCTLVWLASSVMPLHAVEMTIEVDGPDRCAEELGRVCAALHYSTGDGPHPTSEGACALHFINMKDSVVSHCTVSGPTYYEAGIPFLDERVRDGRGKDDIPPADLIAAYGGENNVFSDNILHDGNTAGVYLATSGTRAETGAFVKNNRVFRMRQAGIDCNGARNVRIINNHVSHTEVNGIWLFNVNGGEVRDNRIDTTGFVPSSYSRRALTFAATTTGVKAHQNEIDGNENQYAVFFFNFSGVPPFPNGNTVTNNRLRRGSAGHVGGPTDGNRIDDNDVSPQVSHKE